MIIFRALLCFVLVFKLVSADVPFDDVKLEIFENRKTDFETNILNSLKIAKNFFGSGAGKAVFNAGAKAINFIPFIKVLSALLPKLGNLLAENSDWRPVFAKAITEETNHAITHNQLVWLESTMQTIEQNIPLLDEQKQPDIENRKANALYIQNNINTMMNYFDQRSGLFKKYPLVTAPLLVSLASIIAVFTPLANSLIPIEAKHMQLTCKAHDVLLAYRSRAVFQRTKKLNLEYLYNQFVMDALKQPFNENGYNQTNPGILHCDSGCEKPYPVTYCKSVCRQYRNERNCVRTQCKHYELDHHSYCISDAFGSNKYNHNDIIDGRNPTSVSSFPCVSDYVGLVRHRVENIFPVAILDKLCDRRQRKKTDYGWLTIHIGLCMYCICYRVIFSFKM